MCVLGRGMLGQFKMYRYYWKWGSGCLPLKSQNESRLMERKVCFILDAGNRGWWGQTPIQRPTPPTARTTRRQEFYRLGEGTTRRNSKGSSDGIRPGPVTSDQCHLDALNTVSFQFQGQSVPISLRPVLTIV